MQIFKSINNEDIFKIRVNNASVLFVLTMQGFKFKLTM